jgi:protein gp37
MSTGIQYLDAAWNPVHGCLPGLSCWTRCWARRMAHRQQGMGTRGYERGFVPTFDETRLAQPLHWKKPRRIGVSFMGDLFVDGISNENIAAVWGVMAACPQHTFLVLTKRTERMEAWFKWVTARATVEPCVPDPQLICADAATAYIRGPSREFLAVKRGSNATWPLANVWIGTSVMNRADLPRIDVLRRVPAVMRCVSFEPLLENLGHVYLGGIDWVVVGCEAGPGARTMEPGWARGLKNQSVCIGIAYYLKQMFVDGKLVHAPLLDGARWQEIPEVRRCVQ